MITPIKYEEASNLLGVASGSLRHAVRRGVLTQLPREGVYQHVIKEQVELFRGKWLSLSSLDAKERAIWQALHDEVYPSPANPVLPSPVSTLANQLSPATLDAIARINGAFHPGTSTRESEVPQGSNFIPVLVLVPLT